MKHCWALPAFLRIVLASQHSFSVHDDLLAFPQYQVVFSETVVSEEQAESLFASTKQHDDAPPATTVELTQTTRAHDHGVSNPFKSSSHNSHTHNNVEGYDDEEDLAATYERVVLNAQPYLCRIPIVDTESNGTNASSNAQDPAEEEKELARASDRGWELLRGMQGNCIYFLSGWWSYSFCYNEGVKQFHQLPPSRGVPIYPPVEDEDVTSYILGRFPKDKSKKGKEGEEEPAVDDEGHTKDDDDDDDDDDDNVREESSVARLETKGETRYLVQKLTGGTTCDLTGKERKIEVQFHCHPNKPDHIGMIKELSTCAYLMVIYTPRLCNDVAFLPPQENRAHAITCGRIQSSADSKLPLPVSPPNEIEPTPQEEFDELFGYAPDELASDPDSDTDIDIPAALLQALGHGTSKPLPTIGGTVVGAQSLVGGPGKVIEKTVVVGGGKETFLGTVAESDGRGNQKVMTPDQLRKLNIKDPKDVDDLRKRLGGLAGDRGWRLELIDTPRGREFRGVIVDPDEKEEEEGGERLEGDGDRGGERERERERESGEGKRESGADAGGQEGEAWEDEGEDQGEGSEETFFREEL